MSFDDRTRQILDCIAAHFASRRHALEAISRFGNRYEAWIKWEAAIALHIASYTDVVPPIECVAVEREYCDLFVSPNPWPEQGGYPAASDEDLWIEIKARTTSDKGKAELASWLSADREKLINVRSSGRVGQLIVLAILLAHPSRGCIEEWIVGISDVQGEPWIRRIHCDARHDEDNAFPLLATLMAWEV